MLIWFIFTLTLVPLANSEEGVSNDDDWAYQWYSGESFRFLCHISGLNLTRTDYVSWKTPAHNEFLKVHNDTEYELFSNNMVQGYELLIKNINPNVHGVYTCKVHNSGGVIKGHTIYGLNIHEVKYHKMIDKYKRQINVAVIATAVFLVPMLTTCFVWHFQYVTPEMEARAKRRKMGQKPYIINNEMQAKNGHLTDAVASPEWNGAYDNKEMFTQL